MKRRDFLIAAGALAVSALKTPARAQQSPRLRLRRDLLKLRPNDPFFGRYAAAVQRMHQLPESDPRNWRRQAAIHLDHCPHGQRDFFSWHRYYLYYFEETCRSVLNDPSFALPYWDWTGSNGVIPAQFYDVDQLRPEYWRDRSDMRSPRGMVRTAATRDLRKNVGLLTDKDNGRDFTPDKLLAALQKSNFDVFARGIEGTQHNAVHKICGAAGGHMGNLMSPLDPIFWLHHCNVDRLWAQWQDAGNVTPRIEADYDGWFFDSRGQPVTGIRAEGARDYRPFGYAYDRVATPTRPEMKPIAGLQEVAAPSSSPAPVSLVAVDDPQSVRVEGGQGLSLPAAGLGQALEGQRSYRSAKILSLGELVAEKARVVALLSNVVQPPEERPTIVRVFVSGADAAPGGQSVQRFAAPSFSFFGPAGHHGSTSNFALDITEPLRFLRETGALSQGSIMMHFMPVAAATGAEEDLPIDVGRIELVSA
jgi:tyrosinase